MVKINPYFITEILSPITGLADDDEAVKLYRGYNIKDETFYKKIIQQEIAPYFYKLDNLKREKVKQALNYYLATSGINFERVFESCLPPFDPPEDPRDFFKWIWEELFPAEDCCLLDNEKYVVFPNVDEPNQL